ncbi:hypothetical protein PVAP13_6KG409801 [Panicum virgatum]|uniref:Uncharacterized protein n=1 Tax=Panicum virgatum TaxID=38727 RepID=A0A8T0RLC9_PANVG|nr:hypothetical protein PVAP13_6KG409801 [Panicum virgatum]
MSPLPSKKKNCHDPVASSSPPPLVSLAETSATSRLSLPRCRSPSRGCATSVSAPPPRASHTRTRRRIFALPLPSPNAKRRCRASRPLSPSRRRPDRRTSMPRAAFRCHAPHARCRLRSDDGCGIRR